MVQQRYMAANGCSVGTILILLLLLPRKLQGNYGSLASESLYFRSFLHDRADTILARL
jgi:hypothetical protein